MEPRDEALNDLILEISLAAALPMASTVYSGFCFRSHNEMTGNSGIKFNSCGICSECFSLSSCWVGSKRFK
jgi:hypothetical protein